MIDKYILGGIDRARAELATLTADMITRSSTGHNCACVDGSLCVWHASVYNRILDALEEIDVAKMELVEGAKEMA